MKRLKTPSRWHRERPLALVTTGSALLKTFVNRAKGSTAISRCEDLRAFARWQGSKSLDAAAKTLLTDKAKAHALARRYIAEEQAIGKAPKTIQHRVSTLRSLVKTAHEMGLCSYLLDVTAGKAEAVKDTRGPSMKVVRRVLELAKEHSARDYAVVRLFVDLALRVCEVADLGVEHVNLLRGELSILGKGRDARERVTLPVPTREALSAYLLERGEAPGPLWVGQHGRPMLTRSLYRIVRDTGKRIGVKLWPHALRHTAITNALELTHGDVRKVRMFSRHKSLDMLLVYDDARTDAAASVSTLVAKSNSGEKKGTSARCPWCREREATEDLRVPYRASPGRYHHYRLCGVCAASWLQNHPHAERDEATP